MFMIRSDDSSTQSGKLLTKLDSEEASLERDLLGLRETITRNNLSETLDHLSRNDAPLRDKGQALESWRLVSFRIANSGSTSRNGKELRSDNRLPSFMLGRVISFLCAALVLSLGYYGIESLIYPVGIATKSVVYKTAPGNREAILLSDGTQVYLNAESYIEIGNDFGKRNRLVRMKGQAKFIVKQESGNPFVVNTFGRLTKVLGTEFSIEAYDSSEISIAVSSGRVVVDKSVIEKNQVALTVNDSLQINSVKNVSNYMSFASGFLIIQNLRFQEVIPDINRWYGVDVVLGDSSLRFVNIDAKLKEGSIEDLIEVLETTLNSKVKRSGRTLTIYSR